MEPLTREILRGLKEKRDEEELIKNIEKWVKTIYEYAHYSASRNSETYYKFSLQSYSIRSIETMKANMGTILEKLQDLFPDSRVYYESRINLVENLEEFIMIDWT
jgi:hypothetical protein